MSDTPQMNLSDTPRINRVLEIILADKGELSEETAPRLLVKQAKTIEREHNAIVQAAYNLSMFLREYVAPADAGKLRDEWPLVLATNDEDVANRLKCYLMAQEETLKQLGYPVTP